MEAGVNCLLFCTKSKEGAAPGKGSGGKAVTVMSDLHIGVGGSGLVVEAQGKGRRSSNIWGFLCPL